MFAGNRVVWLAVVTLLLGMGLPAWAAEVVVKVVMVEDENEDPTAAGKAAAEALKKAMGDVPLKAVVMSECFEDKEYKAELLEGINAGLPDVLLLGQATYGSFTQDGCTDFDAVCLMGIGGRGLRCAARLTTEMGTSKLTFEQDQDLIRKRLHAAGEKLASKFRIQSENHEERLPRAGTASANDSFRIGSKKRDDQKLMIVMADAHSPKVQYLVEGIQKVVGKDFPITGGCANKNAGQTFIYYRGQMYEDAAVALMLSGDFSVALSGRMANEEQAVIDSAADGVKEVLAQSDAPPAAVLSFNCAGRRSKLNEYEDELVSMQKVLGKEIPLFGCYCAGEIGPVDEPDTPKDALSGGSGWHVMFTTITPTKGEKRRAKKPADANVSGRVTIDGAPLAGGVVTLLSEDDRLRLLATTDNQGEYVFKTERGRWNVPSGVYKVAVSLTRTGSGNNSDVELLPPRYSAPASTQLTFEVAPGINTLDMQLRSD